MGRTKQMDVRDGRDVRGVRIPVSKSLGGRRPLQNTTYIRKKKAVNESSKQKSTIEKETIPSSPLKIVERVDTILDDGLETIRKMTDIVDRLEDKISRDKQDQEFVDTTNSEVYIHRGFNKNFQDNLRQLFIDHELERTSSIDRIIASYQNQVAMLDKELISKCDELRTRSFAALETLKQELSQEVWEPERTPSQPVKTEYIEYELKQECL